MKKLIAVRHELDESENIVVVDWGVSDTCNFNCSYCPPDTHRGRFPFYSVEKILAFSNKIMKHYKEKMGKEIYFIFTGGEVTLFKDFLYLVKILKEGGNKVGISTNGSKKEMDFWKEVKNYLAHISLSYHVEYTDLDHFIRVIHEVSGVTVTHVNIMIKPDMFQKCIDTAYRVFEETENITMDLQIILKDFIEPYSYTDEQREKILQVSTDINSRLKFTRVLKGYRGKGFMRLLYSDGYEELIKGANIMTRNIHSWKNWHCKIGIELLVVDVCGNIRRSWCGQGGKIGHVSDDVFYFPESPYICQNEWCTGGITDLMITKCINAN